MLNDQTIGLQSAVAELTTRNADLQETTLHGEDRQHKVEADRDQSAGLVLFEVENWQT